MNAEVLQKFFRFDDCFLQKGRKSERRHADGAPFNPDYALAVKNLPSLNLGLIYFNFGKIYAKASSIAALKASSALPSTCSFAVLREKRDEDLGVQSSEFLSVGVARNSAEESADFNFARIL